MHLIARFSRYFALQTYETRQAWRLFKREAADLWQYWSFRRRHKVSGEEEVMHVRADHPIFDPKNDGLFTKEAAHRAFAHLKPITDEELTATVFAVLHEFKQVRVESGDGHQYAITPKTAGVDFDELVVGQRLELTVDQRGRVLHAVLIAEVAGAVASAVPGGEGCSINCLGY